VKETASDVSGRVAHACKILTNYLACRLFCPYSACFAMYSTVHRSIDVFAKLLMCNFVYRTLFTVNIKAEKQADSPSSSPVAPRCIAS
jgi:hypothetical protein